MTKFSPYSQRMRYRRICITFFTLFIATASTPLTFSFQGFLSTLQVLAQTTNTRKAEADRLLKTGLDKFLARDYKTALQFLQQALTIFQEIRDREQVTVVTKFIGITYSLSEDREKAIDYLQQALEIARSLQNRKEEGDILQSLDISENNQSLTITTF